MNFGKLYLEEFIDATAAECSTPGGGSVAAVVAAQAIALLSMVCRFTIGKEKFKDHESKVIKLLTVFEESRNEALRLADEDTVAFERVMKAYKLPKEDETRKEAIQNALKESSKVPLAVYNLCLRMLPLTTKLAKLGNPMLISDVKVAVHLLEGAVRASVENIEINLCSIKDHDFVKSVRSKY